jgi:predicted dehydrogenase
MSPLADLNPLSSTREILVVGAGSIGRRHVANLETLGWTSIRLLRTGRSTLPDTDLARYPIDADLERALSRKPLAVVVANPSALHLPVARAAAAHGAHLLIEKPLSHTLDGIRELTTVAAARDVTVLVGFQFRFHPGLRRIKAWLDEGAIGDVISVQAHWGEFLPAMHPWEDYRQGYAAREDLGGGVLHTFCHPFDYLRWLIGDVELVTAVRPRRPALDVPVDTCVDVMLRFGCGASGHVHLNFVQRPPEHRLVIVGTEGTLTWSQSDHTARRSRPASGTWETAPPPEGFDRNWMFLDEMRHFLACLRGEAKPVCTLHDGIETLRLAVAASRAVSVSAQQEVVQ